MGPREGGGRCQKGGSDIAENSTAQNSTAGGGAENRTAEGGAAVWGESKDGVKGGGGGCQKGCSDIAENSTDGNSTDRALDRLVQRIAIVCDVEDDTVRMAVRAVGSDFDAVLRWVRKEKAMVGQNRAVKRTKEARG